MKIVITGSLGNISKPLAQNLAATNNEVTVVTRSQDKVGAIEALGAKAAVGDASDVNFLVETFTGADVIYLMIPPSYQSENMVQYIADAGKIYADATRESGVKRVVALSGMGAHLPAGNGPLSGLAVAENHYRQLADVAFTFLRPGGFYVNYLPQIGLIKNLGIAGDNTPPSSRMLITHPLDIADVAADAILNPDPTKSERFIISDELTNAEITALLGQAIGKPDLQWVKFDDEQYRDGLLQNGFSQSTAQAFIEMGNAFSEGRAFEIVDKSPEKVVKGTRSFARFATDVFAPAFNQ